MQQIGFRYEFTLKLFALAIFIYKQGHNMTLITKLNLFHLILVTQRRKKMQVSVFLYLKGNFTLA